MPPAAGAPEPIPLTVLTGFLGAGKTTILNRLLRDPALTGTVVIVNEFGEVGLDHLLIESVEDDTILLAAGCICCTVRGDLVTRLEDLLRRRDNGRIEPFRRVVIETTGLADPIPVLASVLYHPYLSRRFTLRDVVTAVDAVLGATTLERHAEAARQVAVADRIILTKGDLPEGAERITLLQERIRDLNPAAPIRRVAAGDASASDILGEGSFDPSAKTEDVRAWLLAQEGDANGAHRHGGHHHHDVNRHGAGIRSLSLTADRPIPESGLDLFLGLVRDTFGPRILRLKGILDLVGSPDRPVVVQGVQHVIHVTGMLPAWPDGDRRSRLVMIVDDLPIEPISRLWDAAVGRPAVDQPDAAALHDNPLAPATMGR